MNETNQTQEIEADDEPTLHLSPLAALPAP